MLDEFKLCPLEKITVIPNGHEHINRWRPERSTYASSLPARRPFVFVLGSRARHKNVEILFEIAKELDAMGLDLLVAGASNRYFSPLSIPSHQMFICLDLSRTTISRLCIKTHFVSRFRR